MFFAVVYNFRKLNLQIVEAFCFQINNSSFTSLIYVCTYWNKKWPVPVIYFYRKINLNALYIIILLYYSQLDYLQIIINILLKFVLLLRLHVHLVRIEFELRVYKKKKKQFLNKVVVPCIKIFDVPWFVKYVPHDRFHQSHSANAFCTAP